MEGEQWQMEEGEIKKEQEKETQKPTSEQVSVPGCKQTHQFYASGSVVS